MLWVKAMTLGLLAGLLAPQATMAQAIGEYGRSVQGGTERQKGVRNPGTTNPSRNAKGKNDVSGVGDLGAKPLASQLVVAADGAGLYPRQDEESEKIDRLSMGETLVPILQSSGGTEWYMVRTPRGKVGWVKSTDIREDRAR